MPGRVLGLVASVAGLLAIGAGAYVLAPADDRLPAANPPAVQSTVGPSPADMAVRPVEPSEPVTISMARSTGERLMSSAMASHPLGVIGTTAQLVEKPGRYAASSLPGTAGKTTMVFCHSRYDPPMVCNGAQSAQIGDTITLQTYKGTLTYRIENILSVSKSSLRDESEIWKDVDGRLVLITCHIDGYQHVVNNLVLFAHLIESHPSPAASG